MEETKMKMEIDEFVEKVRKEVEAGTLVPFLHLEPFYKGYLETGDWEGMMEDILVSYEISMPGGINMG